MLCNLTYDDLYRLTSASTTAASSTPYIRTYSYNGIGNITSTSHGGTYTYNDDGYNNPHAADSINSVDYTYDNNGNVTGIGSDEYEWDYRNRLNEALIAGATTTYGYDHNNLRVKKAVEGGDTTVYPNRYYSVAGATTTMHVFDDTGTLLATLEGDGTSTTTQYIHTDHLGGTNVVTDETQAVVQTLDYYPFGDERIETGTFSEQRQFTGHEKDDSTDLTYAEQRYYEQDIGRWISQDPVFVNLPNDPRLQQVLQSPQLQNSYSYAANNPLKNIDTNGEYVESAIDVIVLALSVQQYNNDPTFLNGLFVGADAVGLVTPVPAVLGYIRHGAKATKVANYFRNVAKRTDTSTIDIAKTYAQNIGFRMNRRVWTQGTAGDNLANLVGHFTLHGQEFGAKTAKEYYNKANDFVDSGNYVKFEARNGNELWDSSTNTFAVTDKSGNIRSFYKPSESKAQSLNTRASKKTDE